VRHYVLTTAYRGPDYPLDANRRRIDLLRGITARSLAAQGTDWTWIVYVNPADPLLDERMDAFRSAGAPVIPIQGGPENVIDWAGPVLTTRIDDDDAFAPDAFHRLHHVAASLTETRVLMFPFGYRTYQGRYDSIRHRKNAWSSVYATGEQVHAKSVQHQRIRQLAPVIEVDTRPAWLWVRHPDTNSGFHRASRPLNATVRRLFPIDWSLIE
jgi:hypothetical protein